MHNYLLEYIDDARTLEVCEELIDTIDKNIPFHLWGECLIGISIALADKANTKTKTPVSAFLFAEILEKIKVEQEKMRCKVVLNCEEVY